MKAPPPIEPWPITATIKHFKQLAGIGSTTVYELIKSGEIRSVTIGRRRLIVMESYRELLEERSRMAADDRSKPARIVESIDGSDNAVVRNPLINLPR